MLAAKGLVQVWSHWEVRSRKADRVLPMTGQRGASADQPTVLLAIVNVAVLCDLLMDFFSCVETSIAFYALGSHS